MPKKKQKAKKITLAGGQAIEQRPNGRDRTQTHQPKDAADVVLKARMRRMGWPDKSAARSHLAGDEMGLCIWHDIPSPDEQGRLWAAWQAVCSARLTYRMRILGTTGQPQGAAIAIIPEAMQTDQSHSVDIRTAEERDIAAKRGDAYWAGLIAALPAPQYKRALMPAMDETEGALWRDAAPTKRGLTAVQALVLLAKMHEGGK
jgi:hypothetical protein